MEWAKRSEAMPAILLEMESVIGARRRRRIRAVTASLCALLLVTAIWRVTGRRGPRPVIAAPTFLVHGAPSQQTLPDGSTLEMREGGKISLQFSDAVRLVVLEQGDAFFNVAKNPARPFVVSVNGIEVRAVGTAFAVRNNVKSVHVLVTEGHVAVETSPAGVAPSSPVSGPPEKHLLAALKVGGQAVVNVAEAASRAEVSQLSHAEMSSQLSWRIPVLEFTGTPLAEVIDLMNRHLDVRLVLDESALRDVKLSGMLRANNVETLLKLLEEDHGIHSMPSGSGKIGLRRKR